MFSCVFDCSPHSVAQLRVFRRNLQAALSSGLGASLLDAQGVSTNALSDSLMSLRLEVRHPCLKPHCAVSPSMVPWRVSVCCECVPVYLHLCVLCAPVFLVAHQPTLSMHDAGFCLYNCRHVGGQVARLPFGQCGTLWISPVLSARLFIPAHTVVPTRGLKFPPFLDPDPLYLCLPN